MNMTPHKQTPTSIPDTIARIVSIALVPPSISAIVLGALVLFYQHGSVMHQIVLWIIGVLFSGGIQIGYVLWLRKQGKVNDYDVPDREHRTKPYLISIILAAVGFGVLFFLNANVFILSLMLCYVTNTLFLTVVNLQWKMSAHMFGLTGMLPFLLPATGIHLLFALPIIFLLGWARIQLHSHTFTQVLAGSISGFLLSYVQLFIILSYILYK